MTARVCAWCRGPIPARARRDSVCCSKRCRQARHRFRSAIGSGAPADVPLRLAYADPPYPGNAHLYREHPDYAGEVDHAELIERLGSYDGWALSTSASALPDVLALCPPGRRVAAWVRGERPTRSAGPLNAWEPVIYFGGRGAVDAAGTTEPSRVDGRRVDVLVYGAAPRLTDPDRVIGAKPAAFARWVFDLLGASTADTLDDLYPGSGGIGRAWRVFTGAPEDLRPRGATRRAQLEDESLGSVVPRRYDATRVPTIADDASCDTTVHIDGQTDIFDALEVDA